MRFIITPVISVCILLSANAGFAADFSISGFGTTTESGPYKTSTASFEKSTGSMGFVGMSFADGVDLTVGYADIGQMDVDNILNPSSQAYIEPSMAMLSVVATRDVYRNVQFYARLGASHWKLKYNSYNDGLGLYQQSEQSGNSLHIGFGGGMKFGPVSLLAEVIRHNNIDRGDIHSAAAGIRIDF